MNKLIIGMVGWAISLMIISFQIPLGIQYVYFVAGVFSTAFFWMNYWEYFNDLENCSCKEDK